MAARHGVAVTAQGGRSGVRRRRGRARRRGGPRHDRDEPDPGHRRVLGLVSVEAGVLRPGPGGRDARARADGRAPPPVLRPLHRRRLDRLSRRRPVLQPLRQDRGHRARAHRRDWPTATCSTSAGARRGARSGRTWSALRRVRGRPGRHHRGDPRRAPRRRPARSARPTASTPSTTGLEACRRVLQRDARPAVLRLYDEAESRRNFDVDACVLIVLDEGDDRVRRGHDARRRRGVRGGGDPRRRAGRDVARAPKRRGGAGAAVGGRRLRGHDRGGRRLVRPRRDERGRPERAALAARRPSSPRCTSPTRTSTARACTSPSPDDPRATPPPTTARRGTRRPVRSCARAAPSATTTAWAATVRASSPTALGDAYGLSTSVKGLLDPGGRAEPGRPGHWGRRRGERPGDRRRHDVGSHGPGRRARQRHPRPPAAPERRHTPAGRGRARRHRDRHRGAGTRATQPRRWVAPTSWASPANARRRSSSTRRPANRSDPPWAGRTCAP